MATDFIDAFRRLQRHERRQALDALATELTSSEWRALISSRTFHCDFIRRLPLELVAHVFSHLDVAAPYRLRIVSKHWNHKLGSLHILKTGLDQWYQGTADLGDADHALCERKARAIHAFRTGKPTSVIKIILDEQPAQPILAGNHLVLGRFERHVHVLNLDSWQLRSLCGEAREKLSGVFVSDQIIALTTYSNICYVYELQGGQVPKKFSVPNMMYFTSVACRGRTIACVAHLAKRTTVFIWEYNTQRGRSFEVSHGPDSLFPELDSDPPARKLVPPLLQPEAETIILFSLFGHSSDDPKGGKHLAFSRYTYSGECIGTFRPCFPGLNKMELFNSANGFVPVNHDGSLLAMRIYWISQSMDSPCLLRFDEKANDLRVWEGSEFPAPEPLKNERGTMAWLNDTCYGFKTRPSDAKVQDMVAYMGTKDTKTYTLIVSEQRSSYLAIERAIMTNGEYVIRTHNKSFFILCFDDDNGSRPKESDSFFDIGELEVLFSSRN
ncbi:F-box multi-domain protein [Pyrenophora tritici-repentis]|nr:F-box multi-domain protein [Pyrenophora tritici-repentis]